MKKLLFCAVLAGLLIIPNAFADTITGSGAWQPFPGVLDQTPPPYWDNISTDGSMLNIGYYLTKTGGFSAYPAYEHPGAIPFWGDAGGNADPSFYFQKTVSSSTGSFKLEIAGNAANNEFGWYNRTGAVPALGDLHPIFVGSDTPASPDQGFTPTGNYAFYIKVSDSTFYTTEGFSVGNGVDGFQHFAVFDDGSSYWIGMEDFFTGSDHDYNDLIVKITPVPEPVSMLLLGSGLIGLAGFARRRFKK